MVVLVVGASKPEAGDEKIMSLPGPMLKGKMSLEEAIHQRRSVRQFKDLEPTVPQIGQLCWAGQGITDTERGFRASPSAGALYPIELYVVTAGGVAHYLPAGHALERHLSGDVRKALGGAALGQSHVGEAPVCVVITAVVERSARKYRDRAERYCLLEAGHVAQNILLQATAMQLAGVPVGAFGDREVAAALKLPDNVSVLYLLPIGYPE
jgi:SagB-type dehydrogenase family enzyme